MFKSTKKLIIGIIVGILLFNTTAFAYDDIPHTSEYFYAIEYLRRNDVFPDKKLFRPDIIISKAEFIKYLVKLNNPDLVPGKIKANLPFQDTRNTSWYAPYFQEALRLGILSDRTEKINPYNKITVYEAIELLFHSRSIPIPRRWVGTIPYKDVENNKGVQALVMRAVELGVVAPEKPDKFGLYRRLTRARAAHMIYKMDLVDLRTTPSSQAQVVSGLDSRLQKIISVWELINANYVKKDDIDAKNLSDNAIRSMVEALEDPYSAYMDESQNATFSDEFDGEIEGIGAFVGVDEDGNVTIVAPIKDSPAYKAGVKAGDVIIKVGDFDAVGATLYDVVNHIKGPKGTKVELTLRRDGRNVIIEVVRDVIVIEPVEYEVIGNGRIMHIKLLNFNENAPQKFQEVVEIITKDSTIKGVILDVRNNPGGLLSAAIGILNYILPNNSAATHIKYNYFNYSQYTQGQGELNDYPMVVLANKGSASASEIVAGALKEYDVAKIVGETTFGKGTVQEVNYFGDTSSLKLTVAEWLTPNWNSIQGNGIAPDIEVVNTETGGDRQLDRAISELNKLIR